MTSHQRGFDHGFVRYEQNPYIGHLQCDAQLLLIPSRLNNVATLNPSIFPRHSAG